MSFLLGRPNFRGYVKLRGVSNNSFVILLMEETLHQLRLVVYPIVSRVLYILVGCLGFLPSTARRDLEAFF